MNLCLLGENVYASFNCCKLFIDWKKLWRNIIVSQILIAEAMQKDVGKAEYFERNVRWVSENFRFEHFSEYHCIWICNVQCNAQWHFSETLQNIAFVTYFSFSFLYANETILLFSRLFKILLDSCISQSVDWVIWYRISHAYLLGMEWNERFFFRRNLESSCDIVWIKKNLVLSRWVKRMKPYSWDKLNYTVSLNLVSFHILSNLMLMWH